MRAKTDLHSPGSLEAMASGEERYKARGNGNVHQVRSVAKEA